MKPEYVNRFNVIANASDKEMTILFLHKYVVDVDKETTMESVEVAKVVMPVEMAADLIESLTKCLNQYKEYIEKEGAENER